MLTAEMVTVSSMGNSIFRCTALMTLLQNLHTSNPEQDFTNNAEQVGYTLRFRRIVINKATGQATSSGSFPAWLMIP